MTTVAGAGMLAAFAAVAPSASAQTTELNLSFVAGDQVPGPPTEGPATSSHLQQPTDMAFDPAGNLYVADSKNCAVEKITPAGQLSVFVGTIDGCGIPRNGVSSFDQFVGLAWSGGHLYVGGTDSGYIYRADANGNLTIVAGSGGEGIPSDGPALLQQFDTPTQMAAYGNALYFGDKEAHKVLKLDLNTNMVTVIAGDGNSSTPPSVGQPATQTSIDVPMGIAVDNNGIVYVADNNASQIYRIAANGTLLGSFGHTYPVGMAFDPTGTVLYVASMYGTISEVDPITGDSVIVAGQLMESAFLEPVGVTGQQQTEVVAGPALATPLGMPYGVEVAAAGEIYSTLAYPSLVVKLSKSTVQPVGSAPPFTGPDTPVTTAVPSIVPSVSPSAEPSITPSTVPTATPTAVPPSVVPSEVPTTPGPVVTTPVPVPPNPADPPRVNLNLALTVDAPLTGAKATVSGGGLQPASPYTLTMYSTPIELARGTTNAAGAFNATITMPAKACVTGGSHRLVLTGTAPGGGKLEDTSYVVLDDTCKAKSINNVTAPVNNTVTLQSFTFPHYSAKLRPKAVRTLGTLKGALTSAKSITITGYTETDSKGKAATKANKRLALKRANAVRAQMRKMGVTIPITTVGAGGVKGLGKGQKYNRRVVIVVRY